MLIHNGTVITMAEPNKVILDGAVLIEEGRIAAIGPAKSLLPKASVSKRKLVDAKGRLILPANICAHTHFYGAFARGMAIPGRPAQNFMEVLKK